MSVSASPGPWHWSEFDALCTSAGDIVLSPELAVREEIPHLEVSDADRALIAIAPEMADLLRDLALTAGGCGKRLGGDPIGHRSISCQVNDSRSCLRCRVVDLAARLAKAAP